MVATEEEVLSLRAVFEQREQRLSRLSMGDRLRDLVRSVVTEKRTCRTSRQRDRVQTAELVPDANDRPVADESQDADEPSDDDETQE